MISIGINEGINSSVVVADNGIVHFALQEERIKRIKNFLGFPYESLDFAIKYLNIEPDTVDSICFSNLYSPRGTLQSFLAGYDASADHPPSRAAVLASRVMHLLPTGVRTEIRKKILYRGTDRKHADLAAEYERYLRGKGFLNARILRTHHHFNHAATAYYGLRENPEETYLVMTLDGGGDGDCSHVYLSEDGRLRLLAATPQGHSIGNIYSHVTHFMGMTPHEHEYKIMGLAAYAKPKYSQKAFDIFKSYIDLDPRNPLVFRSMIPERTYLIEHRFEDDLKRIRFDNIAGGLQRYTEDLVLRWIQAAMKETGIHRVLVSGGVFMNVKANSLVARLEDIEYFDVFPSCGDESLPFGAVWANHAEVTGTRGEEVRFEDCCLGPDPSYDMNTAKAKYGKTFYFYRLSSPERTIARMLADGKIVARCSDRMEFGARALGNRSILADPSDPLIIPEINRMIKQRDFWMPFAPAILVEGADQYIRIPKSLPPGRISPYMMFTFETTERWRDFIAGIHNYDRTARAQIVVERINPKFHALIRDFAASAGKTVVLNTSFNLHGYPIVMGAVDAMDVMQNSSLSYLVINDTLVTKAPLENREELRATPTPRGGTEDPAGT